MNKKPNDDLTVIKGLGPIWQQRLQASGVRTFSDLAALSNDEIVSRLKAADQPTPTNSQRDAWISQAQELVAAANLSNEAESEPEDSGEQTSSPTGVDEWKPFASFVVEYLGRTVEGRTEQRRTQVHHLETDTDTNWPNIVTVELCRWMLEQTGEIAAPELDQLFEETRARVHRELEQELEEQREAAQRKLQETLEEEQTRAQQALQQELSEVRIQIKQQLEKEREQVQKALEQELDEKRAQAQLESEQSLAEERKKAQEAIRQELDEKRAQAQLELEQSLAEERKQAQEALEKELTEKQALAQLESEQSLEEARTKAQEDLEKELTEKQAQVRLELEQSLEDECTKAQEDLEQELEKKRAQAHLELDQLLEDERTKAQEDLEQETLERETVAVAEAQPSAEPSDKEAQPQPEPEKGIHPATQPSEIRLAGKPQAAYAIMQLRAYQPTDAVEPASIGRPDESFSAFISSAELLTFVVDFELAEPPGPELMQQGVAHQVQLYSRDLATGSKGFLGSTEAGRFIEGGASYSATLPDIIFESGVHELSVVLTTVQNGRPIVNDMIVMQLQAV